MFQHVAQWWEVITRGPVTCLAAEEHAGHSQRGAWLKWTVLHSGVTQIKAVPSPCLGTRDPNCIYSNFVCRQKSPGLLFSDFLCNFSGAVVQPNWQSCSMQPLALSSHTGASKTEHCATKERKSLSQPKPDQEGRQILMIFGDLLFCGIKDANPLSWHE